MVVLGAGEMARQLGVLAALPEVLPLFLSAPPHVSQLTTACTSSSGGPSALW